MARWGNCNIPSPQGVVMLLRHHHRFLNNPHWKYIICFCCSCNEKHYTLPFSITELKIELNQLSNWKLNVPSTIYSTSIWLRKSRWCNKTKRLFDDNSTFWKIRVHAKFGYLKQSFINFIIWNCFWNLKRKLEKIKIIILKTDRKKNWQMFFSA